MNEISYSDQMTVHFPACVSQVFLLLTQQLFLLSTPGRIFCWALSLAHSHDLFYFYSDNRPFLKLISVIIYHYPLIIWHKTYFGTILSCKYLKFLSLAWQLSSLKFYCISEIVFKVNEKELPS